MKIKKKNSADLKEPEIKKAPLVQVVPSPSSILSDLLVSLSYEASRLAAKAQKQKLDNAERRALNDFCRSLQLLSKEDQLQKQQDVISNLSDEEIQKLAIKLLGEK